MPPDPSIQPISKTGKLVLPTSLHALEMRGQFVKAADQDFVVDAHVLFEGLESLSGTSVTPGDKLHSLIDERVCSPHLFWQAIHGYEVESMNPSHGVHRRILSKPLEVKTFKEALLCGKDFTVPFWMILALVSRHCAAESSAGKVLSSGSGVQNIIPVRIGDEVAFCIMSPTSARKWSIQSPYNKYHSKKIHEGAVLLFGNPIV